MVTSAMIDALATHQAVLLRNDAAVDDKSLKLVSSGLTDKRSKIKSSWAVAVSGIFWTLDNKPNVNAITFSKSIAKNVFTVFNEVANNGVQASQNGTVISGYAISAATLGKWLEWDDPQLSIHPVKSFHFNCSATR